MTPANQPASTATIDVADMRHSWHPFKQMREYLDHLRQGLMAV